MRIVLATGIYPPEIGGPATYVAAVAHEMREAGHEVTVVTYGEVERGKLNEESAEVRKCESGVLFVSKSGGVLTRWKRYAKTLKDVAADADRIYVFTSVSAGVPLMMARLKGPKKILRLGGDFFWERYTDAGGMKSLVAWYGFSFGFWRLMNTLFMKTILGSFDHVVYSTQFQQDLHRKVYGLTHTSVISNARPVGVQVSHQKHSPFKLLFMGRFVRFKNISSLIIAMRRLEDATLTIVGDGPIEKALKIQVSALGLSRRVSFKGPVTGEEKNRLFDEHDLLVIPSVTEISPNVALEAVSRCLPVLLTRETGLTYGAGIVRSELRTPAHIASAVRAIMTNYEQRPYDSAVRTYKVVASDVVNIAL